MRVDYLILKILKNIKFHILILLLLLLLLFCTNSVHGSESPERECCDPKHKLPNSIQQPPPQQTHIPQLPPIIPTTIISPPSIVPTGRSGSHIKTAIAILNCILARQLCFEDPSCSAILEIIPRVCGPVPVACSTVTVTKCQAALRTLQAFPFFRPTCLCKEPGIDPDCNYFRDFLFDHPCGFVLKKEKDPYPIDALPTCNHALSVCQQERKCIKLFEDFKVHCKVRENKCRMEDRDLCLESWTNLRLSPMFGCICPNNHMKRRCDRIFSMVNHNPCVDEQTISSSHSNKTLFDPDYPSVRKNKTYPSYPHYLYPSKTIPLALASHKPVTTDSHSILTKIFSFNSNNDNSNNNENIGTKKNQHARKDNVIMHMHNFDQQNEYKPSNNNNNNKHRHIGNYGNDNIYLSIAREMGIDESNHLRLLDENLGLVETPLIASPNSHYLHHPTTAIYPYNLTGFLGENTGGDTNNKIIIENGGGIKRGGASESERESSLGIGDNDLRIPFQSTCHTAMEACRDESLCLTSLQNVLMHCETHRCNRNACMDSLQYFYRASHEDISLDVAFCLCKKTNSRYDTCMIAQEKLHPTCAQRPPESLNIPTSNGVVYIPPPACHIIADLCKEDAECRLRLELYEQSCAIDSVTKKCAGKSSSCRSAILGILGTLLRTSCACQGVDQHQLYDCLGWQKLLWLNPCVVESQKDFHMKRLAELGLLTTSTTTTTTTSTTTQATTSTTRRKFTTTTMLPRIEVIKPSTARSMEPPIESNYIDLPDTIPETIVQHRNNYDGINATPIMVVGGPEEQLIAVLLTSDTTTQIELTSTTTTVATTTVPMRYCVVQRAHQSDQYIAEGQSQRILLDDLECSELCTCGQGADPLALTCYVLCVPLAPCRTALAYYSHAAPAYQAFRGRCLCYSGRFICMRPPPGEYFLPGGVFLLLGYSSTDEALLRPHTNLGVQDAVRALHHYLQRHINNETSCTLTLFNMTEENVILSARLPLDIKINPIELLRREKEQCTPVLDKIAQQINSQQKELTSHPLLSIFKMAEVQVIWPELSSSSTINNLPIINFKLSLIVHYICWKIIYKIQNISYCR